MPTIIAAHTTAETIAQRVADLSPDCLEVAARSRDWSDLLDENGEGYRALETFGCPSCDTDAIWSDGPDVLERAGVDVELAGALAAVARETAAAMYDDEDEDGEMWRAFDVRADALEAIADQVEDIEGEDWPAWRCPNPACERFGRELDPYDSGAEGPMMSYDYPLPDHVRALDEDDAYTLRRVPLCIVSYDDGTQALALTGGGMDLTWEIAEAFILLGYLPPVAYCDLPGMAGRGAMSGGGKDGAPVSERDALIIAACRRAVTEHGERIANRTAYALEGLRRIAGEPEPVPSPPPAWRADEVPETIDTVPAGALTTWTVLAVYVDDLQPYAETVQAVDPPAAVEAAQAKADAANGAHCELTGFQVLRGAVEVIA